SPFRMRSTTGQPQGSLALPGSLPQVWGLLAAELEAAETLVEAGDHAAMIHQALVAAGPGRVRLRIDFQNHGVPFLTPGGAGLVGGAIGHLDGDGVVIRVNVLLHGVPRFGWLPTSPSERKRANTPWRLPAQGPAGKTAKRRTPPAACTTPRPGAIVLCLGG